MNAKTRDLAAHQSGSCTPNRTSRIEGVLSPVVTPFRSDYSPDADRFVRQCRWLLNNGVGLAMFGTNSEGNSLSVDERIELLDRLVAAGLEPARMMPSTGCCALSDSVRLSAHASKLGCVGVLMLPPFYYKGISDEGLFRCYASVIEKVGDEALRVYLYQIPSVTQVNIGIPLLERLLKHYPNNIAGIKDTSGDWNYTQSVLSAFAGTGFSLFAGNETILLATMRGGGAGCISATANVNPAPIHRLFASWRDPDADAQQAQLNAIRAVFQKFPMIPALKAAIAYWGQDSDWARLRPPLVELTRDQSAALVLELKKLGFEMSNLAN